MTGDSISQATRGVAHKLRTTALIGLAASVGSGLLWQMPLAHAATVQIVNDPCDLSIVAPGQGAGVPNAVEAAPGTIVQLTVDGLCAAETGPVFDRRTGTTVTGLVAGNGPSLLADGVTLDLNGHSITQRFVDLSGDGVAQDVFSEGAAMGIDLESAGVDISGKGTKVTNSSLTQSVVSEFTTNFSFAKAENAQLVGQVTGGGTGNTTRPGADYNIVGRNSHLGGALSLDKSKLVTIDTIWLDSRTANGGDGLGADLKRSDQITLKNSRVDADVSGVRWKQGNTKYALRNSLVNGGGVIVRTINDSGSAPDTLGGPAVIYGIFGNVITDSAGDGISIATKSTSIPVAGNTIQNSVGCGLSVSLDSSVSNASNVVVTNFTATSPLLTTNSFSANAGGDLCRK